jgi:catechol 2,3-dioxygenase-like lactoylglutathione lyase family enzyme
VAPVNTVGVMSDTSTKTRITHVGTVIIPIADQDAALAFYTEKLGFELRSDQAYGDGFRWIEVAPQGAQTTVALAPPPEDGDTGNRETGIGLSSDDVEASHAELKSRGVDVEDILPLPDPVPPMFWFKDPEGNRSLVVQRD